MGQLNFGHRLGLLKRCWGFAINQDFADYLSCGETSVAQNAYKPKLRFQTVHSWISKPQGFWNSTYSQTDMCVNFAKFCVDPYKNGASLASIYNFSGDELLAVLLGDDDVQFIRFVANHSSELPSAPSIAPTEQPVRSQRPLPEGLNGRFMLYRLGIESKRKFGKVVPGGENKRVLRRIPIEISKSSGNVIYREKFIDGQFQSESTGTVLRTKDYVNIIGQDRAGDDYSEWFFFFLSVIPEDDMFFGLVAMDGDIGVPSAYRVILKSANQYVGSDLDWDQYCETLNRAYPIYIGPDLLIEPQIEPDSNVDLTKILAMLSLNSMNVGIND